MASGNKGHSTNLQVDDQQTSTSMDNPSKPKNGMEKESSKDAKQGHQPKMKEMAMKNGKQGKSPDMKNNLSPKNVKHPPRRISLNPSRKRKHRNLKMTSMIQKHIAEEKWMGRLWP
ncbi:unnamed protein product [Linum trigynum]|uniref:Uncharacterized protein n=1 Tax=Linum trigynum TaxID=586398 RepID=A0AAV2FXE8_9ROSI